jgi:hypothetical protein
MSTPEPTRPAPIVRPPVRRGIIAELWGFLAQNKKWWLLPILLALLVMGLLVVVGGGAAAPFIYTLF